MADDIFVALRSIGERTANASLEIVHPQIEGRGVIHEIKDFPFEEAHIRSVKTASQSNARWALFLDADVLLRENAVASMIAEAESFPGPFYMLNFGVHDLGFAGPTYGVHLYNARYLEQALEFEKQSRKDQRPESRMVLEMWTRKRIPSIFSHTIAGLHGYEQYYRDLYRTSFVRAVKFAEQGNYLLHVCRSRYFDGDSESADFKMMLWGYVEGSIFTADRRKAPLDASFYRDKAENMMNLLGLGEKGSYALDQERIERVAREYRTDQLYEQNKSWLFPERLSDIPAFDQSLRKRLRQFVKKIGKRILG